MDDNTKIADQNTNFVAQTDQPQVQPAVQPIQTVGPVAPIGSANKEAGISTAPVSDFIKPSETQPQIDKDIAELGVEAKSDKPGLTFEHKALGVDHAGSNIVVATHASSPVTLPMTEEEIADKLKAGEDDDSGKWLAGLIKKIIAWGLKSE